MLKTLLSDDPPRSRLLSALLLLIVMGLLLTPFLFHSVQANGTAVHIAIFVILVASYDLLLGFTGVVSFAHTMFFGIGAYGMALVLAQAEQPGIGALLLGLLAGQAVALVLALIIGLLSLRVRALFFAMISLAVASLFADLATRLSALTGGEDGKSFTLPEFLLPSFRLIEAPLWGVGITGKLLCYYVILIGALGCFLALLRVVNSPFGRVLLAIRENAFRAEAIGFAVTRYRILATIIAALFASFAGALLMLWLRFVNPDSVLSFDIMVDILLMVVIGGVGSLYGAVLGAALVVIAQNYLQIVMGWLAGASADLPLLAQLFDPERWKFWLGLAFILCVYFFPRGIAGRLRKAR